MIVVSSRRSYRENSESNFVIHLSDVVSFPNLSGIECEMSAEPVFLIEVPSLVVYIRVMNIVLIHNFLTHVEAFKSVRILKSDSELSVAVISNFGSAV